MSESGVFDYDRFIVLTGLELCAYMEPLIADCNTLVSGEVLDRLLRELSEYDEYHLVYALQLGADHSISTFLPHASTYLLDEHDSVCCTAFNILNRLRGENITQNLIDLVRAAVSNPMAREFLGDLPDKLEREMESG